MPTTTGVRSQTAYRFGPGMRLDSAGVSAVLKSGHTLSEGRKALAQVRILATRMDGKAKLAIAVPKRILNSAVERNRVKRAVREAFRHHDVRDNGVDMLVSLTSRLDTKNPQHKQDLNACLSRLFVRTLERVGKRE